jgi:hypothetical protein
MVRVKADSLLVRMRAHGKGYFRADGSVRDCI